MKAIKIQYADKTTWALPLNFGQLEEFEPLLKEIGKESTELAQGNVTEMPMGTLRKQIQIIKAAIRRYDPTFNREKDFTIQEINTAFVAIISGSGLEEVPEGETKPGA